MARAPAGEPRGFGSLFAVVASDHSDRNRVVRTVRTLRHRDADVVSLRDQLLVDLLASGLSLSEASAILQIACLDPAGASDADRKAALTQLDERASRLNAGIARLRAQEAEILGLRASIEAGAGPASV